MSEQKKLILFDIDHTLFDTRIYLTLCLERLRSMMSFSDALEFNTLSKEVYKAQRAQSSFMPDEFVQTLSARLGYKGEVGELGEIFFDGNSMRQSIYPDVEEELQRLSQLPDIQLGIFSHGQDKLQRAKIASVLTFFRDDSIYIDEVDKLKQIPEAIKKHSGDRVYIIDDLTDVLSGFKALDPSVITILSRRQDWIQKSEPKDPHFEPDFTISTFAQLRYII